MTFGPCLKSSHVRSIFLVLSFALACRRYLVRSEQIPIDRWPTRLTTLFVATSRAAKRRTRKGDEELADEIHETLLVHRHKKGNQRYTSWCRRARVIVKSTKQCWTTSILT